MNEISVHAPSPQACRPVDQTQCSTCSLSYDCRSTGRSAHMSWPLVVIGVLLATGLVLRILGMV